MSNKHFSELLKGSVLSFLSKIIGIIIGYVIILVIANYYGSEGIGVFTISMTIIQIASVITLLGLDTAILRFTSENYHKKEGYDIVSKIYYKMLVLLVPSAILMTISMYMCSPIFSNLLFHNQEATIYYNLAILGILPMSLLLLHREILRGLKKIWIYSVLSNITIPFFTLIVITVFILNNILVNKTIVISQIFSLLISSIISILFFKFFFKNSQKNHTTTNHISYFSILSISVPMMLSSSLSMIMNWLDIIMLGALSSTEEVGIYSVALKISLLASISLVAINSIAAPKFAELWNKQDISGLKEVVQKTSKMFFWSSTPIIMIIILFPEYILNIFGEEFVEGKATLIILVIGQFVNTISGSVNYLLNMTGNEKFVRNNIIIAFLINIVLNYILIPTYGIFGAALATSISTIYWNLAGVILVKIKLNIFTMYRPFIKGE